MIAEVEKKEELLISWLRTNGYYRVISSNEHIIEADGKMRKMLVGIRTEETKNQNSELIASAISQNREPWIAIFDQEDHIMWHTLK